MQGGEGRQGAGGSRALPRSGAGDHTPAGTRIPGGRVRLDALRLHSGLHGRRVECECWVRLRSCSAAACKNLRNLPASSCRQEAA